MPTIDKVANPVGRPTKYKHEYCQAVIDHMSKGLSLEAFAGECSVSKESVYEWTRVYPEFSDAVNQARAKCQAFWEKVGTDHIINYEDGPKLNSSIWIFNMKARFGWRDNIDIELSGNKAKDAIKVEVSKAELLTKTKELAKMLEDGGLDD